MKQLNKIILIFFVFSFLTIYSGWRFIHSRKFSDQASQKVSEILTKKFGAKLAFTGVDFNIFPPSTIFKNVHIEKKAQGVADIDLNIEELVVSFTYSSFFSSNLELDDLELKNGALEIVTPDEKSDDINWRSFKTKEIFRLYSDVLKKSPLRLNIARLNNINVLVDQSRFLVNKLSIAPHRKELLLKAEISQLHIDHHIPDISFQDLDSVSTLLRFTKDSWNIEKLKISERQNSIELHSNIFNGKNYIENKSEGKIVANVESLTPFYKSLPKDFAKLRGNLVTDFNVSGSLENPDLLLKIKASNFKSEWVELADVNIAIRKKQNTLILDKLLATNGVETYQVNKSQPVFDLKKSGFMNLKIPIQMTNASTNTFLFAVRNSLSDFKGVLSGNINVVWNGVKVLFEINEKAILKDFKLASKGHTPILQNTGFVFSESVVSLDKNYNVGIDAKLMMNNTLLKANGIITDKDLNISIKDSKIDMKEFGPISGLAINGAGPVSAEIYGPFNNVKFDFIVDWNNFKIVDLNLGKIQSEFSLSLKNLQLDILKLNGSYNQSIFNADGFLNFGDDTGMDMKINFQSTNFSDAKKMYGLIFNNLKLPVSPEFNFSTNYRVRGGFGVETLRVDGSLNGEELKIFGEEAEKISFNFGLQSNVLSFKDIRIGKSRGEINAAVTVNLANNYTELEGYTQGLRLRDFNFYRNANLEYDGDFTIDFDGNGTTDNFSSRFKTKITNAFIENIPASSSNAIIYLNKDDIVINSSLLAGKIKLDSLFNLKTRDFSFKSAIETSDIKEILGVVAGHNMSEKNMTGKVKAQLNSKFNVDTLAVEKFAIDINQFNIKKGEVDLNIDSRHNAVDVENSIVRRWDLRFVDGGDFFTSQGKNLANGDILLDQNFSLKTNALEFLSNSIEKAVGSIKGNSQVIIGKKIAISKFEINGSKNSLKIKNLPGAITDLDYKISKNGEAFEILRLTGKYGEGEFRVGGKFIFDDLYPLVNIDYKIERATVPLFKRSSLLASSTGTIIGTELPYMLNGKLTLLYGEFLDDPSDFTKESKIDLDTFKKYLPEKSVASKKGYINLNMAFDTVNPILIKNNLAEVYTKASGQLTGNVLNPEINSRVEIIPSVSKFKFKGHDFLLNQGYVDIKDRGKVRTSDLKFIGLSKINDFDVKLDISGSIEKSNISLSSEPPLAQEDLVSLLTLGVTSDMSKNLEANDRRSVTTVGIGSLLVDQLKINEDLNSTLGLNLSVLPEFKEDETSLVSGKSAVSESGTSKLKTATKIKIHKPITKSIDVSVSSTVGGSIEQTQEMKINYNINKKFSVEGVYEVKPSEDENTNSPNSLGIDLKWRKSF